MIVTFALDHDEIKQITTVEILTIQSFDGDYQ